MKVFTKLSVLASLLVLCGAGSLMAQSKGKATFSGTVTASESEGGGISKATPLAYAVVSLPEIGVATSTNLEGYFDIKSINPGTYKVEITSLGYESITQSITLPAAAEFKFNLKASSFYLENVVVSAESTKTGASTASKISKSAMEHIQATSLADVMSLLPGAVTRSSESQNLQTNSEFALRSGQSFGTAIIMDGAPISNNANMQQLWMATDGATLSQSGRKVTSPQTGIDMRSITTSNIESVEVIRGIASAQYGDITSGAVIINNKAGRTPMEIKADINPNVYMASISHGIGLGSKAGVLNYGIDYTFAQQNPREGYDTYNRATGRIAYSNDIGKWQTTTSLNFTYTKDNGEPNPDDQSDTRNFSQRDLGFKFNTKGSFNFNEGWFKNLKYTVSVDYTNKHSFFKDYTSTGTWTYSTSKIDGAVLSSFPGKDLYTADGTKITNIAQADMNGKAWQLPSGYWYSYDLYGKELNTFAQVMTNFAGDIGNTHHRIIVGAEYRTSGNLGRGKVFDPNNPPFRSLSDNFATQRERAYSDVPFMQHIGAFAEETLTVDILRRKLEINAGVRFDKVKGMRAEVAPRLNASYDVIPEHLSIRGGYGVTYKVPSLGFLYPEDAYFDILNFDNSNQSGFSDAQKFQIATTRSFSTKNPNLIMAKATKWEVGADFKIGQIRGSVTYFRDNSNNGYMVGSTLDSYKSVDYIQYSAVKPSNETDMPVLNKNSENKLLLKYQRPTNNYAYTTEGIEFDIDFGRINAIRTAFGINGSWTYNKYWTNSYSFNNHTTGNSNFHDRYPHMGVFEPGNTVDHNNRTATNLRITHNIPRIGFIVTLTANVVWHNRKNTIYGNDSIPIKYISRLDGKVYDVDRERLGEPEFQGIDMREIHSGSRLVLEPSMPPLLCLNINITKEIRNFMRISFFANNMFRSTPILESTSTPGKYTLRNKDLFFFGAALSIKIK